ncbi:MAG: hypothetical protein ABIN04_15215 [Ginsengibacter sp.]
MIKKNEFCRYCGKDLKAKTAKKVFCDDKCRIYYSRELKRGTLDMPKVGDTSINGIVTERKQHNHSLTVTIEPSKSKKEMPHGLSLSQQIEWRINN